MKLKKISLIYWVNNENIFLGLGYDPHYFSGGFLLLNNFILEYFLNYSFILEYFLYLAIVLKNKEDD